jgi:hypothetical protein
MDSNRLTKMVISFSILIGAILIGPNFIGTIAGLLPLIHQQDSSHAQEVDDNINQTQPSFSELKPGTVFTYSYQAHHRFPNSPGKEMNEQEEITISVCGKTEKSLLLTMEQFNPKTEKKIPAVLVEFSWTGKPLRFYFPSHLSFLERSHIKYVVSSLQTVFPSLRNDINPGLKARVTKGRDGVWTPSLCPAGTHPGLKPGVSLASMKSWTTTEEDADGTQYTARYQIETEPSPNSSRQSALNSAQEETLAPELVYIRKDHFQYQSSAGQPNSLATSSRPVVNFIPPIPKTVIVDDSATNQKMIWDQRNGFLKSVTGRRKIITHWDGDHSIPTESEFELKRTGVTHLTEGSLNERCSVPSQLESGTGYQISTFAGGEDAALWKRELAQKLLGKMTASQLKTEWQKRNIKLNQGKSSELYRKLKAYFYLHPEETESLAKEIDLVQANTPPLSKSDYLDRSTLELATALHEAGSPEAQRALVTMAQSREEVIPFVLPMISQIALLDHPTDSSIEYLRNLAQSSDSEAVATSATWGLGTLGSRLKTTWPDKAKAIEKELVDGFRNASGTQEKEKYRTALQNFGSTELPRLGDKS